MQLLIMLAVTALLASLDIVSNVNFWASLRCHHCAESTRLIWDSLGLWSSILVQLSDRWIAMSL